MNWNNGIENLNEKFKALPARDRALIVNKIINVNGLKEPRLKSWKAMDRENFGKPNTGARMVQVALFEVVASKHIIYGHRN